MEHYSLYYPHMITVSNASSWEWPRQLHRLVRRLLILLVKLLSGVSAQWISNAPVTRPRVYIANHSSHLDFLLIWSALPEELRRITRPVAGGDYWKRGTIRSYLATKVFQSIVINRRHVTPGNNPLVPLQQALQRRQSIILFPEGTRSRDGVLHDFKSGIYHLAKKMPQVEFVPVYIHNANRVLPKGEFLPVPTLCSVTFGTSFTYHDGIDKQTFLSQARAAVAQAGTAKLLT